MKKEFSKAWKGSKQPRKQRKFLAKAPLHIKRKLLSVNLSKGLRAVHNTRNIEVRKEDEMVFKALKEVRNYLAHNRENPLKLFEKDVNINSLSKEQKEVFESFKMRKGFLKEFMKKSFAVSLTKEGKELSDEIKKKYSKLELVEALSVDDLKTASWKGKEFRHYDVKLETPIGDLGRRHPMLEANNILRDVFVEMGFEEMEGPMVESAFWNNDVMWIPQDHPARDEQDTFYLEGHGSIPSDLTDKYKKMHEEGIKRTHTQKGEWLKEIATRRLLRTQSTATSFRTLAELGKKLAKGENVNGKYFYLKSQNMKLFLSQKIELYFQKKQRKLLLNIYKIHLIKI